jgi:hypothetical protein
VECRLLCYALGGGNYKVQDIASHCVFISRDVVFEEGQPCRTSASVGENIPLFDTDIIQPPPTEARLADQQLPQHQPNPDHINQLTSNQPDKNRPVLNQINHQHAISVEPC